MEKIKDILNKHPYVIDFLDENNLDVSNHMEHTFHDYLQEFDEIQIEDMAIDIVKLEQDFNLYIEMMSEFLESTNSNIESITVLAGNNKFGEKENYDKLILRKSEIISIVGPTGSGKSRLLADVEWLANRDTPTNRKILINDEDPDYSIRFSPQNKLVAQLSQNMNFVMDLSVEEFLELHANSRMVENPTEIIARIIEAANNLAGESFKLDTPITALSGGQSRALMIADTAILSRSPIVLIDEIENAGIDRHRALELLVNEEKIVLIATHDPALALIADKRIVINNGAIVKILETTEKEKAILSELDRISDIVENYRKKLRYGEELN